MAEPTEPKKGWTNPALRAMGIRRVALPSRNWMIFWALLASVGGGIWYDKHQLKLIRDKYMAQVLHYADEVYTSDRLPRKLTVFIAPPPNDFLDELVRHFRRYVKPILNAAALDFEVYTANRQGEIRAQVAERIRELRREQLEREATAAEAQRAARYDRSWTKFFHNITLKFRSQPAEDVPVARHDLYTPEDVLGLYKVVHSVQPVRDDARDALCGGVLCVGRGVYKEYINGVHEGLLGPLEKPAEAEPEAAAEVAAELARENEEEETTKKEPVPRAYITPAQYAEAALAPELDLGTTVRNAKDVPVLFEQPVYVFAVPKLSGFMNFPRKIYRYFTLRNLAEDVAVRAVAVVEGQRRPFEYKDKYMGKEEELEWPKSWVERGRGKNSEWVQELEVDDRVTRRMSVFECT